MLKKSKLICTHIYKYAYNLRASNQRAFRNSNEFIGSKPQIDWSALDMQPTTVGYMSNSDLSF